MPRPTSSSTTSSSTAATGRQWPVKLGRRFTSGKYDAFILGDVDAERAGRAET